MILNEEGRGCNPPLIQGAEPSNVSSEKSFITFSTTDIDKHQTQAAKAVNYTRKRWRIFPCDRTKAPIVDPSLGFIHGVKDATSDTKIIAKTWFRYPDAAIGFAIPPELIVIDCDVKKDAQKRPLVSNGLLKRIGLESFQKLILGLNITGDHLRTLSVRTQSGGTHFYFQMPEGIPSFNHVAALPGLDLKGYGGYVILPNSQGQYGRYEFLNMTKIRPIPEPFLKWVMKFSGKTKSARSPLLPTGTAKIDRDKIVKILLYYWKNGDGKRNELTLAIAGFLAHSGGTEADAVFVISELARITGKGGDHISGAKYAFKKNGPVKGFRTLEKLMGEISDGKR